MMGAIIKKSISSRVLPAHPLLATTEVETTPFKYIYIFKTPMNAPVQAKANKALPNQNSPVNAVGRGRNVLLDSTKAWVKLSFAKER